MDRKTDGWISCLWRRIQDTSSKADDLLHEAFPLAWFCWGSDYLQSARNAEKTLHWPGSMAQCKSHRNSLPHCFLGQNYCATSQIRRDTPLSAADIRLSWPFTHLQMHVSPLNSCAAEKTWGNSLSANGRGFFWQDAKTVAKKSSHPRHWAKLP